MKRTIMTLTLAGCLGMAACRSTNTPTESDKASSATDTMKTDVAGDASKAQDTTRRKARWRLLIPAPYIADGKPSVMTPSDDVTGKAFYGVFWGDPEDEPDLMEQCVLGVSPQTLGSVSLLKFPDTLPLAEDDNAPTTVYWHFARNPDGSTPPIKTYDEFMDDMKNLAMGNESKFLYGRTRAANHDGVPPTPGTNGLAASAEGVVEHYSIPETTCEGAVFALPFGPLKESDKVLYKNYEKQRRILQARSPGCTDLDLQSKVATIEKVEHPVKYQDWYDSVKGWGADMTYTDGRLFIAKSFPPDMGDLKAFKEEARALMGE